VVTTKTAKDNASNPISSPSSALDTPIDVLLDLHHHLRIHLHDLLSSCRRVLDLSSDFGGDLVVDLGAKDFEKSLLLLGCEVGLVSGGGRKG
jgi:hypothetical protein